MTIQNETMPHPKNWGMGKFPQVKAKNNITSGELNFLTMSEGQKCHHEWRSHEVMTFLAFTHGEKIQFSTSEGQKCHHEWRSHE